MNAVIIEKYKIIYIIISPCKRNYIKTYLFSFIQNRVVFSVPEACFTKEPCTYKDLQKIEYIVENKDII